MQYRSVRPVRCISLRPSRHVRQQDLRLTLRSPSEHSMAQHANAVVNMQMLWPNTRTRKFAICGELRRIGLAIFGFAFALSPASTSSNFLGSLLRAGLSTPLLCHLSRIGYDAVLRSALSQSQACASFAMTHNSRLLRFRCASFSNRSTMPSCYYGRFDRTTLMWMNLKKISQSSCAVGGPCIVTAGLFMNLAPTQWQKNQACVPDRSPGRQPAGWIVEQRGHRGGLKHAVQPCRQSGHRLISSGSSSLMLCTDWQS